MTVRSYSASSPRRGAYTQMIMEMSRTAATMRTRRNSNCAEQATLQTARSGRHCDLSHSRNHNSNCFAGVPRRVGSEVGAIVFLRLGDCIFDRHNIQHTHASAEQVAALLHAASVSGSTVLWVGSTLLITTRGCHKKVYVIVVPPVSRLSRLLCAGANPRLSLGGETWQQEPTFRPTSWRRPSVHLDCIRCESCSDFPAPSL